jgi:hypothetical protein
VTINFYSIDLIFPWFSFYEVRIANQSLSFKLNMVVRQCLNICLSGVQASTERVRQNPKTIFLFARTPTIPFLRTFPNISGGWVLDSKMRLLNTTTLQLHEFCQDIPNYAILSHRWEDDEVSYQDLQANKNQHGAGYRKIRRTNLYSRFFSLHGGTNCL